MVSNTQSKYIRSLKLKKFRDQHRCFIAEGKKCIEELRQAFTPQYLVVGEQAQPLQGFDHILTATASEMAQLSSLTTPTDYLAVFHIRQDISPLYDEDLIVALDGVQDPGNLGTILRTCDWMGIRHIIASRQTADCFSPKVVQATMGALARVTIDYTDLPSALHDLKQHQYTIYGTTLKGTNIYTEKSIKTDKKKVIVMGNEGNGISDNVLNELSKEIQIPSFGVIHVESLNVSIATAIVLSEIRRIAFNQ